MDSIYLVKYLSKLETLDKNNNKKIENFNSSSVAIGGNIIGLLIGAYAAYLSYECNSRHNMGEPLKIVYALFAFFFGLIYLLYYLLFRSDYCRIE
jgi:Kef-type K+ transport system membrane component KefB